MEHSLFSPAADSIEEPEAPTADLDDAPRPAEATVTDDQPQSDPHPPHHLPGHDGWVQV